MTPSEKARVQECVQELSEILYRNTPSDNRASRFAVPLERRRTPVRAKLWRI
nr:hypothetical protein [Myxosarcina sp. GI1]